MKNRGNYYKYRSKQWLIKQGYQVEYLERLQRIVTKSGKLLNIKRDMFCSDLMAISKDEVIFANSVFGRLNIASHIKAYKALVLPKCKHIKVWVLVWEIRAKDPEIIDCKEVEKEGEGVCGGCNKLSPAPAPIGKVGRVRRGECKVKAKGEIVP